MINLRVIHPVVYILIVVTSLMGAYAFKLRTHGIFACTAEGYRADRYLGYCDADAYGDYDHGAVWFGLEPDVRRYAANADVLFLGSSRMQFAFSTIATDEWFASASASHYLLGFSHTENANFAAPLLARIKPQAKVYVVNVDSFFNDVETGPASQLLHDKEIETRYKEKALWQRVHRKLCGKLSSVCGKKFAYFRAQKTGHWVVRGVGRNDPAPVADDAPSDQDKWDKYGIFAKQFIASLPVDRSCVLLTVVPYPTTRRAEAEAIASAVGIELISPTVEDLRTFDGSHLDHESAQRWSKAFFDLAGPRIQRCLASTTKAAADQSSVLP